jgi:hypothetical protein
MVRGGTTGGGTFRVTIFGDGGQSGFDVADPNSFPHPRTRRRWM